MKRNSTNPNLSLDCVLCGGNIEDAKHLFFDSPVAKAIYGLVSMTWHGDRCSITLLTTATKLRKNGETHGLVFVILSFFFFFFDQGKKWY